MFFFSLSLSWNLYSLKNEWFDIYKVSNQGVVWFFIKCPILPLCFRNKGTLCVLFILLFTWVEVINSYAYILVLDICGEDEFTCFYGYGCLDPSQVCNKYVECLDYYDEWECGIVEIREFCSYWKKILLRLMSLSSSFAWCHMIKKGFFKEYQILQH